MSSCETIVRQWNLGRKGQERDCVCGWKEEGELLGGRADSGKKGKAKRDEA